MRRAAPVIAIAATLLTLACVGVSPALAHVGGVRADDGSTSANALARRMDGYWRRAPREVGGRCTRALSVPGLGPSCRSRGGMWRVRLADGTSLTTHGPDAPPAPLPAAYFGAEPTSVTDATVDDIACVDTATTKYTALIYAYASDQASRYGTVAPLLRQETYGASAFLDAEAKAVDATKSKRLQLACDEAGIPIVYEEQLATASGADSFSTIVADLRAKGYGASTASTARDRYLVFYDSPVASGAAGTGHLYTSSYADVASSTSSNNRGGSFAVEFAWNSSPHWDILLHEAGHNMGAVQDSAPNTSSAGHCNDGHDIMCYNDGGATSSYTTSTCATELFDCGRDDYFHPSPAPGGYFDTHWNVAATYNLYLSHLVNDLPDDPTAPTTPTSPSVYGRTSSSMTLSWGASTDNVAVAGYRIYDYVDGAYTLRDTVAAPPYTASALSESTSYSFGVAAYDAAGNESAKLSIASSTLAEVDATPPTAPTDVVATPTMTSVALAWTASTDTRGVDHYNVYRYDTLSATYVYSGETVDTGMTISGLAADTPYSFAIEAVDTSDNASDRALVDASTLADSSPPTAPSYLHSTGKTRSSVTIAWNASSDNVGLYRYRIYRYTSTGWKQVATTTSATRIYRNASLRAYTSYSFRVRAADAAGNLSAWSSTLRVRTSP